MFDQDTNHKLLQEKYIQNLLATREQYGDETALAVFLSDLRHELTAIINTNHVVGILLENEDVATDIHDGINTIDRSSELALQILDAFRNYCRRIDNEGE